jgi:ATP-dependent Clp protease ATP-binding subunit ClpC
VFERWSDDAKQALARAQGEAQRAGQHYIGADHLLLGVLEVGDLDVAAVLQGRSSDVEANVIAGLKRGRKPTSGALPVKPVVADLMESARREAEHAREEVRPVHLLRALAASGERSVTAPLRAAGVDAPPVAERAEVVPEDLVVHRELERLSDEVVLLRAEVAELRRRLDGRG